MENVHGLAVAWRREKKLNMFMAWQYPEGWRKSGTCSWLSSTLKDGEKVEHVHGFAIEKGIRVL